MKQDIGVQSSNDPNEAPIDPDFARCVDYHTRELSDAEAEAVEQRVLTDDGFAAQFFRVMRLWNAKVDWKVIADRLAEEEAHSTPIAAPLTPRRSRLRRTFPAWARRYGTRLAVAAAALLFAGRPVAVQLTYAGGVAEAGLLASTPPAASSARAGTFVLVPPGGPQTIELAGGSRLRLTPQTRLTYRRHVGWPTGWMLTLRGEAYIDVSDADGVMYVGTMHGTVVLLPGTYAVRCALGCETIQVSVGPRGVAWLKGSTPTEWTYRPLTAGQHAELVAGLGPVKTDGEGYPSLRPW